jgi:hypothetical protein
MNNRIFKLFPVMYLGFSCPTHWSPLHYSYLKRTRRDWKSSFFGVTSYEGAKIMGLNGQLYFRWNLNINWTSSAWRSFISFFCSHLGYLLEVLLETLPALFKLCVFLIKVSDLQYLASFVIKEWSQATTLCEFLIILLLRIELGNLLWCFFLLGSVSLPVF